MLQFLHMARGARVDVGGYIYHVINRANARVQIFDTQKDYIQFECILEEAVEKFGVQLLAYCIMPNHWHLIVKTLEDGDLQKFMSWLTNTHTRRFHAVKRTIGHGHLYQGRYKSFLCEEDTHYLTLMRYVERNAKKANLVSKAEEWQWSSVWRRERGTLKQKRVLTEAPVVLPTNYLIWLNEPQTEAEEIALEHSIEKNVPFGTLEWVDQIINTFSMQQTQRGSGRPKKPTINRG
jgi:putative transposase